MHYQKIQQILSESDPREHWICLSPEFGRQIWFYVADVNLRIETSLNDVHADPFEEQWATKHPDKHAKSYYYNIWYASTLVDQIVLVSVDGGRARLPLPDRQTRSKINRNSIAFKVAQIADPHRTLYEYIERSGLTLVDEED